MSIYLDNAATSYPKPPPVYDAVLAAMQQIGASPGRGSYGAALQASRLLFETREALAAFSTVPTHRASSLPIMPQRR